MASATVRLALHYRRQQALISARLMRQIMQTWRDLVDPARVDATWPALRSILGPLVLTARTDSVALARAYYIQARTAAGIVDDGFTPAAGQRLEPARLERTLDITGPIEFKRAITAGRTPERAVDAAAVRMAGSTQYLALDGGRQVMKASIDNDERATGWARVTDNDPCAWCAMLASRGPVYKSAGTAGRNQNSRFTGDGEFKYHDLCACQAVPSFTLDEPFIGVAEQLYDDWRRETRAHGGKDAVNAFRRWWEAEGRAAYAAPGRPSP